MAGKEVEAAYLREVYLSSRRRGVADVFKRAGFVSGLIVVTVAVLALVAVSPLALEQLGSIRGMNWTQLSNIGQTYGAASALLTGLALIGVAGSMVFQARAIQVSRAESMRGQHAHLIEMSLADPVYLRAWGFDPAVYGTSDRLRQLVYINLIVSFWEDHYRLGDIKENTVRGDLVILFRGEAGREFWSIGRYARMQAPNNRREMRFHRIVDEEYQKAVASGPPAVQAQESLTTLPVKNRRFCRGSVIKGGAVLAIGAMGGIVLETLRQRKR